MNARSLMSTHKLTESETVCNLNCFQDLVYSEQIDIVCVNETWLNGNIDDSEILNSDYTILRKDRETRGGGVLLAIKSDSFKSVREVHQNQYLEIISAEITTSSNSRLLICSCYRPPNADQNWLNNFNHYLNDVCSCYENIILVGDFNMPHISWNSPENTTGAIEISFLDLMNDYFLSQLNNKPTRRNNVLDLVLTNVPNLVNIHEVLSPTEAEVFTDHNIILFDVLISPKSPVNMNRTVYDYQRGNFDALRSSLESENLSNLISVEGDIDYDWLIWKSTFLTIVADHIPTKRLRSRKYVPWLTGEILHNIKKKNSLRQRLKKSPSDYLRHKFKSLRATIKLMIKISRSNYISSLCTNIQTNSKRFWSLFKLKGATRSVPEKISTKTSVDNVREYAENPRDIATLFNRYFVSIFPSDPINIVNQQPISETTNTISNDIILSEGTARSVLRNLDNNKAHGPDEIPARLLTETAYQIAPSLCLLFNKSLKCGIVPREWKIANVVPIHKKGDKDHVENYRPISLPSLVSKVLERCVFISTKEHAFSQINSCQHGFTSGKSCVTQLIEVLDTIGSQLDLGKQIDVIYLDMSKAFDKVSHVRLLHRLREFGFGGNLLMWFNSYLKNRRQQTTVLGATSTALPVTSGVPQGSILGPLLFLLYTNDLSSSIVNSNVAAFADDTKIFKVINSRTDAMLLQNDLLNFNSSSSNAGLHLNTPKCKTLQVTRKYNKIDFPYQLQDTTLEKTDCELDLGVWTNYDLTWSKQVTQQSNKANKMLGYIRRSTFNIREFAIRRTLYLSLVRSHLGYATQVWAPQTVELVKRVERVQRRATKYILNVPFICDTEYRDRLLATNLLPLSYWHEYLDVVFFYKANHDIFNIDKKILPLPQPQGQRQTRSFNPNSHKYKIPTYKTSTYEKSYKIRTSRIRNTLPNHITSKERTFSEFKNLLFKYYILALENIYDVEDPRTWKSVCIKRNSARSLMNSPLTCCSQTSVMTVVQVSFTVCV